MKKLNGNKQLSLNASEKIYILDLEVSGTKGTSNGKILLDCSDLVIKDSTVEEGTTCYNVFEQKQTVKFPLNSIKVDNVECLANTVTHNIFNAYNLADNATINIENCKFDLNVAASNIMRLSNYMNAENVSVCFKNVEWTYETLGGSDDDFTWAGLVIFQPAGQDLAFTGDLSKVQTWSFTFENCKYNGEPVTENNFGKHSQVLYLYNVNKTGKLEDPSDYGLNIIFK